MQDRPDARELLEAVADFLESEVMPELSGRTRFHTRVSVNLLRLLRREWRMEEDAVRADWDRLRRLLGLSEELPKSFEDARAGVRRMNEKLASEIRAGAYDDRWDEVRSAMWGAALDKLRIANPSYAEEPLDPDSDPGSR